ncbi:hypothetical protein NliqN6_5019 [Naganishia liquefaciens]|uniref:AAA family ATPase n=1 Tax=Naganishia liquefaciens TaxID=104408 RepID=A0A8H3YHW8_9TREE|nr:hypothetical protein NliqN6_5019 [Naganishia liquefaciens]
MLRITARQPLISNAALPQRLPYSTGSRALIAALRTQASRMWRPLISFGFSTINTRGATSTGLPQPDIRINSCYSILRGNRSREYALPAPTSRMVHETASGKKKERHRPHLHWKSPGSGGSANKLDSTPAVDIPKTSASEGLNHTGPNRTRPDQKEDTDKGSSKTLKKAYTQSPQKSGAKKLTIPGTKKISKSSLKTRLSQVIEAAEEPPAQWDADDAGDVEEYESLTAEALAKGPQIDHSAAQGTDFDIIEAMIHNESAIDDVDLGSDDLEDYAPELNVSMRSTIQDIQGIPARGTKTNPIKGNWDPLEIASMAQDREAGAEDSHDILRNFETEETYAERDEVTLPLKEQSSSVQTIELKSSRSRRQRKARQLETSSTAGADAYPLNVNAKTKTNTIAGPAKTSTTEDDAVHVGAGLEVMLDQTCALSRFRWWERATSRHALSRTNAKKNTPMRRSPRVQRLNSKHRWYQPLKGYTDHFAPLIEAEHLHEETVIRQRLDAIEADQLVAEGYCLNNLQATRDSGSQAGRPTYTFAMGGKGNQRFTWNRFNPGTSVIISRAGGTADPIKKQQGKTAKSAEVYNTGSVISKTQGNVKVSFDEPLPDEINSQSWRLDIWTSDIVMRRAKEALATLHYDPIATDRHEATTLAPSPPSSAVQIAFEEETTKESKPKTLQTMLAGTALRSVLLNAFATKDSEIILSPSHGFFADNQLIQSWCRRQLVEGREPLSIDGDPQLALNTSQRKAIAMMLSSNMSLVQGPPGTGKTRTIIETLHLLKIHWEVPYPILVSAYTNTACDNLAEGMHKRGLKVLRYGSQSRIREDLKEMTLDWYLEQHPRKRYLDRLKAEIYKMVKDDPKRDVLRRHLFGIERRMMYDVLLEVDVVCATCISSRGRLLDIVDFPVVFLDEASMATEPNALIPLTKGCQHAALIGDHKQLPPLVISKKAAEGALHISLFERLINENRIPSVMLDTQYRMHPDISAFPNKAFYDSQLKDGTAGGNGVVKCGLEPPKSAFTRNAEAGSDRTVTFLHHWGLEKARANSVENESEAKIIYDVVVDLLAQNPGLSGKDIGVISPYAGQISRIMNELRHDPKRQVETWSTLGSKRGGEVDEVEIHTVDGFEGREKQVIIFSTTRSNPGDSIGFLKDWRRMNVGLTRAKSGLIIVGNRHTLGNARRDTNLTDAKSGAEYWSELIRDLDSRGSIIEVDCEGDVAMWGDREADQQNEQFRQELDLLDDIEYGHLYEEPSKISMAA